MYHKPVMLAECLDGLNIKPDGVYVDVTFGGGGHSKAILERLTTGKLFAFDQDSDAVANAPTHAGFTLVKQNFKYLKKFLRLYNALPIDGLLADLGVSSHQFDVPDRGFSTRFNAELDMRMNTSAPLTAKDVINKYSEEHLRHIFSEYGEVANARKLASVIVSKRGEKPITTVDELKAIMAACVIKAKENQYLAQVFQALRIEVNSELDVLKEMLLQCGEVIRPGGRLVVMSYHSLEDRLVKNYIAKGKFEGELEKDAIYGNITELAPFKALNKKPVEAGDIELKENPRARSAKLRVAEKV